MRQAVVQPIRAVVGSASINGSAMDFRQIYRISGQVIVGAGAATAGSLQLQYSNDPYGTGAINVSPSGLVTGVANWSNFGTAGTVAGAGVVSLLFSAIPFADIGFSWVRAVYTDTSGGTGAGTITVNLNVQGF